LSLTLAQLQPLVQSWLAAGGTGTLRIAQLAKNGDTVSVELKGPSAPPPTNLLAQAISKKAGQAVTVSVSWQTTSPATASAVGPATDTQKARTAVTDWLAANPGPEILSVTVADAPPRSTSPAPTPPRSRRACGPLSRPSSAPEPPS
jgi:hypothetical protein